MKGKENRLILLTLITLFGLLASGYTVKNADYMVLAEKYTDEYQSFIRKIETSFSVEELEDFEYKLEKNKTEFMNRIKESYSSDVTDRVMLNVSYRKFNKRHDSVLKRISMKKRELSGVEENGMVTIELIRKDDILSEKVEDNPAESEKIIEDIEEEALELVNNSTNEIPESLVFAVYNAFPAVDEKTVGILKNDNNEGYVLFKTDNDDFSNIDNNYSEDILNFGFKKDNMAVNIADFGLIKEQNEYSGFNKGESFKVGNREFVWKDGKYLVSDEKITDYSAENLVIQIKDEFDNYGKALIYDGKSFFTGLWVTDEGETVYYDNFGSEVNFNGKNIWINISNNKDISI
ncbi:MAG: hypothetical protein WC337_00620 [Candidatus Muiribacteriota bacterium]